VRTGGKSIGKSTSKKRRVETSSSTKQKGKITLAQAEKNFVKGTPPSTKKRKTRTLRRKKIVSQRMSQYQSSSSIVIDESPWVLPKDHNLLVLVDVAAHIVVNEENVEKEDNILLSTLVHGLRNKNMTSSAEEVQEDGHEDDEAQHMETLDNFNEHDIETLNDFYEQDTKSPPGLNEQGTESPEELE